MHYILKVDQQVWERHTVRIEVPDDTPEDEVLDALIEKYKDGEFDHIHTVDDDLGNVDDRDPEYNYEPDWFTEQP